MSLLTPNEVADKLKIPKAQVRRLNIDRVRIGQGRGQLRYRQEDVDRYINERIESPEINPKLGGSHAKDSRTQTQTYVRFRGLTPLGETKSVLQVEDKGGSGNSLSSDGPGKVGRGTNKGSNVLTRGRGERLH